MTTIDTHAGPTRPGNRPAATTTIAATDIDRFRRRIAGSVFAPGDPGYDHETAAWNRTLIHRPQLVVRAADHHDVVAAIEFASETGLGLGVQATGHGGVLAVDGVLLVTSDLDEITIDPEARTARLGAGTTWGPVLAAASSFGLAPLLGSSPSVGTVGYTLGGGLGWLARPFGAASDRLRSIQLVTPDGRIVDTSATERPELFHALRGGGGGAIGVIVSIEIELVEVDHVVAGNLWYPSELAGEVADAWTRWVADAPATVTSSLVHMNVPPAPDVPEALRGRSFTIVRGCIVGDLDAGHALVDRLRAELPPLVDQWGPMRFADSATISNDPVDPLPVITTGGWLDRFEPAEAATLASATFATDGPPPLLLTEVRHLGGALRLGDGERSVIANRDGEFLFHAIGVPMVPGADAAIEDHLTRLRSDLADASNPAAYLNFIDGAERRRRSADAIAPEQRQRVADVHRWFDPAGVLRFGVASPA